MARLPVAPPARITPHGAFGYQRRTAADGRCGYRNKYPCTHLGVDLAAPKGAQVVAPESGYVVVASYDNVTQPLRGYGPGAVVFLGDSGMRHILGHLDPEWWRAVPWQLPGGITEGFIGPSRMPAEGRRYREGEVVGVVAKDHVHWEVSTKGTRYDPVRWAQGRGLVAAGRSQNGLLLLLLALAMGARRKR